MPRLDSEIDVSPSEVRKALKIPSDFGYSGDLPIGETWSLGPALEHRDSDLLAKSNSDALKKYLESDPSLADDWQIVTCRHWEVGWIEHLAFRAVEDDGETPTRIFRVLLEWTSALLDYPVADDSDYARREHEAALENIESEGYRFLKDDAPDDWAAKVFSWLWDNNQEELENSDGNGAYPSEFAVLQAMYSLRLTDKYAQEEYHDHRQRAGAGADPRALHPRPDSAREDRRWVVGERPRGSYHRLKATDPRCAECPRCGARLWPVEVCACAHCCRECPACAPVEDC